MESFNMKPISMFFDMVQDACPYYKDSKCCCDEFDEDDCSVIICARKQAYYNKERNFSLNYEVDRLRKENKELKEGSDKVHISESPFVPYSPRLNCCTCTDTERCNEQKERTLYPVLEIVSDIRRMVTGTDVTNNINKALDRLLLLIPSNTRCDIVLEKQLLQAEHREKLLRESFDTISDEKKELEEECVELKNKQIEIFKMCSRILEDSDYSDIDQMLARDIIKVVRR
jgi:hypothetical protein